MKFSDVDDDDSDHGDWILMLVTSFECWWLTLTLKEVGFWWSRPSPASYGCDQHIPSPTFVTNIDMSLTLWLKATIICILEIPLKWLHKPDVKKRFWVSYLNLEPSEKEQLLHLIRIQFGLLTWWGKRQLQILKRTLPKTLLSRFLKLSKLILH